MTQRIDATGAFVRNHYRHICKTHQTLLMLRRSEANRDKCKAWKRVDTGRPPAEKAPNLELRHQRTGDVVFDFVDEHDPFKKPMYFVYKLIETLLPKAMAQLELSKPPESLKMVELWAQDDAERTGWLKIKSLK